MKKLLFIITLAFTFIMSLNQPHVVFAQLQRGETSGPCDSLQCRTGQTKISVFGSGGSNICACKNNEGAGENDIFGTIDAPAGVAKYNTAALGETGSDIGLILFLSNIIRIATVVAGIWVMINFILAGWSYITSAGDSKAATDASAKMTNSLIGLAIIIGSYTLAAIIGLVFFGDASYILNPQITGVGMGN